VQSEQAKLRVQDLVLTRPLAVAWEGKFHGMGVGEVNLLMAGRTMPGKDRKQGPIPPKLAVSS